MGLVVGFKELKSKAVYHVDFYLFGANFSHTPPKDNDGITNPRRAYEVARGLVKYGLPIKVSRTVTFDSDGGYVLRQPERQEVSMTDLEKMASSGDENLPVHSFPLTEHDF